MSTQTKTEFTSSQGQRAGALQLTFNELTKNEQLLVTSLATEGRPVRTIQEIMDDLNWHKIQGGRARGCSRVRNTLRRLVRSQWVTHESEVGDGKYRLTKNALDRLRRLVKDTEPAKPAKVKPTLTAVPAPATEQEF
jgi:hypothetical protein